MGKPESMFDELFIAPVIREPVVLQPANIVTYEEEAAAIDHVKEISNRLLKRSADIVEGSLHFAELDPDTMDLMDGPPEEWVLELGEEAAKRRFRLAKSAWQSSKDAPMGIKMAADFVAAESKARAMEKQAPKSLNVAFVSLSAPLPQFPSRVVESDQEDK